MFALPLLVAAIAPVRVDTPPRVDGRLDDAAWASAPASDAFTQKFPRDGARPSQPTRVQVVYDDDSVYIAIDCVQTLPSIARLTRRDREVGDDRVSIDLDTNHDRRSAFHFQLSAAGVQVDGLRYDDTSMASDWDDIWDGEVARTPTGWSAEIRIPLRVLRLRRGVSTWGFQVRRWTGKTGEIDEWAYASKDVGGEVSRYGDIGPFDGLAPHGHVAVIPFGLSRLVRTDAAVPSSYGDGPSAAAGLDVIWRPSAGVAIAAAVLPDFAQVEADQVVLNLSTTETEYPEKRPFFLQGLDLFQTPIQLLYTRRIGQPAESPALPDGVTQQRPVGTAPILGAAKLLANVSGVELGALAAITGGVDASTDMGDLVATPLATHHVVRARYTRHELAIGALATARTSNEDLARYPTVMTGTLCPSGAIVGSGSRCTHDAYTGGLDGAWRSEDGTWVAGGQLAATRMIGASFQRPDGTVVASGDTGVGGIARLAKEGGALRFEGIWEAYGKRFVVDDLGFQDRANIQHGSLDIEAYSAKPLGPFVESRSRLELFYRRIGDGLRGSSGYQWNASGTTEGMWSGFLELHWRPSTFDDREFGDGRALQHGGKLGVEASLHTDRRRDVIGGLEVYAASMHAAHQVSASASLEARPRDDLELSVAPELFLTRGEPRFVGEDASGPQFARQDATSFGVTARATWTLRRSFTLQAFAQGLLATIRYRDAFIADPGDRVIGLADLRPATFDPAVFDAREGVLDATVVGRWEYRPGSTAFLVYTHAQAPLDGATYDPRALIRGPASDVVLLKLSWAWLR